MWKALRTTGVLEGVSYVLLLGVGMPLKYLAKIPEPNLVIGMAHGVLFVAYVVLAWAAMRQKSKTLFWFAALSFLALLPLGTFYADRRFLRNEPPSVR